MLKRSAYPILILVIAASLAGLSPATALAGGSFDRQPTGVVSMATVPVPAADVIALPDDFAKVIQASPLTAKFEATFDLFGWKLSYADGIEFFAEDLGIIPSPPSDARGAMVPLIDSEGFGVAVYSFTYGTQSGSQGAEVVEVIAGDSDASDGDTDLGANTLRVHLDPSFETFIDMVVNSSGDVIGAGGSCPISVPVELSRDSAPFASRAESCGGYWWCLGDYVARMGVLGQATGLTEACVTFCTLGGVANPGCLACLVGGVGALFGAWWDC